MINRKKVIISLGLIMLVISFCVIFSYSQEKPPTEEMKRMFIEKSNEHGYYKNVSLDTFLITNSFFSKENGRYCVVINYIVSVDYTNPFKEVERRVFGDKNGKFSFDKRCNQWYIWKGWGPGED